MFYSFKAISPLPFRQNIVTNIVVFKSVSQSLLRCIFYFVYRDHPGFQNISLNVFSKVYLISLPTLPLFSKCILELLFNTIIRPLKFVYWQSKGLPSLYVSGKVRGSEDTELHSAVKRALKLIRQQPSCSSLPPSLPAYRCFSKRKSCIFLNGMRNHSPCTQRAELAPGGDYKCQIWARS